MIAEDVTREFRGLASYKPLAAYVLRMPASTLVRGDPLDWGLDRDRHTDAVDWAKAVNSVDDHLGWAIKETDLVQQLNKRAFTNKSYHYVVSFPEGERPPRDVLEHIESVLTEAIGYGEHQRIMAVHQDTPHLHMHVAISRIHPRTFKSIGSHLDHLMLQRTTAQLESLHGLTKANHTPFSRSAPRSHEPFVPSWQIDPPTKLDPALKAARALALAERSQALASLKEKHARYFKELTAWHKQRRTNAFNQKLGRADRVSTTAYLREVADRDHEERKAREKQERDALKAAHPLPTLEEFTARQQREKEAAAHARMRDEPYTRDIRRRGQDYGNGRL